MGTPWTRLEGISRSDETVGHEEHSIRQDRQRGIPLANVNWGKEQSTRRCSGLLGQWPPVAHGSLPRRHPILRSRNEYVTHMSRTAPDVITHASLHVWLLAKPMRGRDA